MYLSVIRRVVTFSPQSPPCTDTHQPPPPAFSYHYRNDFPFLSHLVSEDSRSLFSTILRFFSFFFFPPPPPPSFFFVRFVFSVAVPLLWTISTVYRPPLPRIEVPFFARWRAATTLFFTLYSLYPLSSLTFVTAFPVTPMLPLSRAPLWSPLFFVPLLERN